MITKWPNIAMLETQGSMELLSDFVTHIKTSTYGISRVASFLPALTVYVELEGVDIFGQDFRPSATMQQSLS